MRPVTVTWQTSAWHTQSMITLTQWPTDRDHPICTRHVHLECVCGKSQAEYASSRPWCVRATNIYQVCNMYKYKIGVDGIGMSSFNHVSLSLAYLLANSQSYWDFFLFSEKVVDHCIKLFMVSIKNNKCMYMLLSSLSFIFVRVCPQSSFFSYFHSSLILLFSPKISPLAHPPFLSFFASRLFWSLSFSCCFPPSLPSRSVLQLFTELCVYLTYWTVLKPITFQHVSTPEVYRGEHICSHVKWRVQFLMTWTGDMTCWCVIKFVWL